jgi:hypothetical protein
MSTNDTHDLSDPVSAYAEYCAVEHRIDELLSRGTSPKPGDDDLTLAEKQARREEYERLTRATFEAPDAELLRAVWLVDNWDHSTTPPERDEDGEVAIWNLERDDSPTFAADVEWLVKLLVAELRRLRPELASVADDAS